MTYLLDANVFINAFKSYYAFDIAPGFWDSLVRLAQAGIVQSIDWVYKELGRVEDELFAWARSSFRNAFQSTDREDVFHQYGQVMQWVEDQERFSPESISRFAEGADGWLIAYAKTCNCIVVTHESFDYGRGPKVKIPNVCVAHGVQYTDTFTMLRELEVSLVCQRP
ncbi:MAG: DUF4411 family protein [Bacillota bacterium]